MAKGRRKKKTLDAAARMVGISLQVIEYDDERKPGDPTDDVNQAVYPIPLSWGGVFSLVYWFVTWRMGEFMVRFCTAASEIFYEEVADPYLRWEAKVDRKLGVWIDSIFNRWSNRLKFGGILAGALWWSITT